MFDLQRALNVVIDAGLETDSQLGDLTTAAIKEFQGGTPGLEASLVCTGEHFRSELGLPGCKPAASLQTYCAPNALM